MNSLETPASIFFQLAFESKVSTYVVYCDHDCTGVAGTIRVSLSYLSVASLVGLLLSLSRRKMRPNGSKLAERHLAVGRPEGLSGPSYALGISRGEFNRILHVRNRRIELIRE